MSDSTKSLFGFAAIAVAFALAVLGQNAPSFDDSSRRDPLPATGLDLREAFAANPDIAERREHARSLAAVLAIVADGVERDGQQPAAERVFLTGSTVDENIVRVRKFYMRFWSFAPEYPQLGETIGSYLKQRLRLDQDAADTLTDQRRSEWIQALREVQASALQI